MQVERLKSKIHRAKVTDANLHYEGSITIDQRLMEAADLMAGEKVQVVDINNGERLETYVIAGAAGSGEICLNGAAARRVEIGDLVIIISYGIMDRQQAADFEPTVVRVDEENSILES